MAALPRFRRVGVHDLRVGDEIRHQAVYQSRTGYLARTKVRGTILTLVRVSGVDGAPPAVEGLLRDRHGIVQRYRLAEGERVRRRPGVLLPETAAPADEGATTQDLGNVPQ